MEVSIFCPRRGGMVRNIAHLAVVIIVAGLVPALDLNWVWVQGFSSLRFSWGLL